MALESSRMRRARTDRYGVVVLETPLRDLRMG